MKLWLAAWLLLHTAVGYANTPYQLPGSSVIELSDPLSKRVYPVFIQLPASYQREPQRQYPLVVLLDANYSFPLVAGALRFPTQSGWMQEVLLVALSYEKGSRGSSSRIRDFTPSLDKSWQQATGQAQAHLTFLRDTLLPHIERHYRVSQSERSLAGHSLGGLFGAYVLLTEPKLFNNYVLSSPSIWFHKHSLLALPAIAASQPAKVYLAVGELETPAYGEGQDMVAAAKQFQQKLAALQNPKLQLRLVVVPGASHATVFPTTAVQGLEWFYRQPHNSD